MKLVDLPPGTCHYPVTDAEVQMALGAMPFAEHRFCGEPIAKGPYCAKHHRLCYSGQGKDVEALYQMMKQVERTIMHVGLSSDSNPTRERPPPSILRARETTPEVWEEIQE